MKHQLHRYVKQLVNEGYPKSEAWEICEKALEITLQLDYEIRKKITTGQLISEDHIVDILSNFGITIKQADGEHIEYSTILDQLKKIKGENSYGEK